MTTSTIRFGEEIESGLRRTAHVDWNYLALMWLGGMIAACGLFLHCSAAQRFGRCWILPYLISAAGSGWCIGGGR